METTLLLRVVPATSLQGDQGLLQTVQRLVNACYNPDDRTSVKPRYESADDVWQELGDDGYLAALLDPTQDSTAVAVAGIKRYGSTAAAGEDDGQYHHWEIGPVATFNAPEYRKKGLTDRCLRALVSVLAEQEPAVHIKLWIKTVEAVNGNYWRKKGFRQVGETWTVPKGMWDDDEEYVVVNMATTLELFSTQWCGEGRTHPTAERL